MCNKTVRDAIKGSGFHQWEVADELGVSETTLIRWLRKEMTPEKKKETIDAISRLKKQKEE